VPTAGRPSATSRFDSLYAELCRRWKPANLSTSTWVLTRCCSEVPGPLPGSPTEIRRLSTGICRTRRSHETETGSEKRMSTHLINKAPLSKSIGAEVGRLNCSVRASASLPPSVMILVWASSSSMARTQKFIESNITLMDEALWPWSQYSR